VATGPHENRGVSKRGCVAPAREHALERAAVVAGARQVDESREVHGHARRLGLGHDDVHAGLVIAGIAPWIGRVLVDADVDPILARRRAREHVSVRPVNLLHPAADPAPQRGAQAGELGRRLRIERLAVEAKLERDLRRGARCQRQHDGGGDHREPARCEPGRRSSDRGQT
jgi:hypothetical protein